MKKLLFTLLILPSLVFAQNKQDQLNTLLEWVSIPNDAFLGDEFDANYDFLEKNFSALGFETQQLETPEKPLFLATRINDKNLPTVLFYMHFDGQPVDTSKWEQESPYIPVIKRWENNKWRPLKTDEEISPEDRVFARSASDDKGPIAMFIEAFKLLDIDKLPYNVKLILDSQEEQGSPHIPAAVEEYAEQLAADFFLVFDGPMHDTMQPTLVYGTRGIARITMEIYGPSKPQHSGHFGNYAPNPVFLASELLASMKDDKGRVIIDGYYDGIAFTEKDKAVMNAVPDDEQQLMARAGIHNSDKVGNSYQEAMQYPSLNVVGIQSGWVGKQTRTIVPSSCIVEMDIRTVPETDSEDLIKKIRNHVVQQGFTVLEERPDKAKLMATEKPLYFHASSEMYPFRTPLDSEVGNWLRSALRNYSDEEIVEIRIAGGSVPLSFFINKLNVPTVLIPVVNPDNNQHSPNENLRIGNYYNGIEIIKTILTTPIPN